MVDGSAVMDRCLRAGHRGGGDTEMDDEESAKKVSAQSTICNATPIAVEESQRVEEAHGNQEDSDEEGSCKEICEEEWFNAEV
jgi:hypothetical protein